MSRWGWTLFQFLRCSIYFEAR